MAEVFRHGNQEIFRERLEFLRNIQLIAWLRPYSRTWFPGGIPDLFTRELHAVVHHSAHGWGEIIQKVRQDLWETGVGSDIFNDSDPFGMLIRAEAKRQHEHDMYVASVARAHPVGINDLKLRDLLKLPQRPKVERIDYVKRFTKEMEGQLNEHGDKRLGRTDKIASSWAHDTLDHVQAIDGLGGNPILSTYKSLGIPVDVLDPEMTIGEIGELVIYATRLKAAGAKLNPPVEVGIKAVPIGTLPSYVLERKLASFQGKADRVSGSDFGDSYIAPLIFYSDGVEVDKRTFHYLENIRRSDPNLADLMRPFFRSTDYLEIPQHFDDISEGECDGET